MAGNTEEFGVGRARLLALEVRSRRFGFVVIEDAALLDWGTRGHAGRASIVQNKIGSLLDLYDPAIVVIRTHIKRHAVATILAIRAEARRHSAVVRMISAVCVRSYFAGLGGTTKHEIASIVANQFPDLAWNLPPKRRPWESERHNVPVFDAAATALAFIAAQMKR